MGSATVKLPSWPAALSRRRATGEAGTTRAGLAFDRPGGPLVAVCGLVGGAGTSTLAYLVARQAAAESNAPVLLAEPEAVASGLAVLAGRASRVGLTELAEQLAAGHPPEGAPFVQLDGALRLLATAPRPAAQPTGPEALTRLVGDARAAHGLVVIDCRTLAHDHARQIVALASHIVWTLPATRAATAHADTLLASGAVPAPRAAREALAVVATQPAGGARVRDLRDLAASRADHLSLIPHVAALPRAASNGPGEAVRGAVAQLAGFLRS